MSDDCKEQLRNMVRAIADDLENPRPCDQDGQLIEDMEGARWDDENEQWVDEDGDTIIDQPQSAYDWLNDALDIEYVVSGRDKSYLGARVLVCFGGPNVWVDTRRGVVEGYWWGDKTEAAFMDTIGLNDALAEMYSC